MREIFALQSQLDVNYTIGRLGWTGFQLGG